MSAPVDEQAFHAAAAEIAALLGGPELTLDEVLAGLDEDGRRLLLDILAQIDRALAPPALGAA